MSEIKTLEDVYAWLEGCEPYEATAVAARAALRVLPMLSPAVDGWELIRSDWLLPVFRTTSIPWFAVSWETPDTELSEAAKAAFRTIGPEAKIRSIPERDGSEGGITFPSMAVMLRIIVTTQAAVTAFTISDKKDIKRDFEKAFVNTGKIYDNHLRDLVKATTTDITALEGGMSVAELSAMPLWLDGKVPEKMNALWGNLKSRLPEDEHWDVWTEWYEDRLRGTRADKELEKARILIPDEEWDQGPAHVNAIIKRLIITKWLHTRRPEEATLLAARAVLRILPALSMIEREDVFLDILLPVFRATSVPWFSGTWLDMSSGVVNAAFQSGSEAKTASSVIRTAFADQSDAKTADQILRAAMSAAQCAHKFTLEHYSKATADAVMDRVSAFYPPAFHAIWEEVDAIRMGETVSEISESPLWHYSQVPAEMVAHWNNLKSRLPKNEDWDVWTTWYDARLRGAPADKELEKARILIPDEDWQQGPAHVNAIIKRLIVEHQGFDFENLRKITANAETLQWGSPEELEARAEVGERAGAVEAALLESPEYGGIGHNRPPEEIQLRKDDLSIARESVAAIREEAQAESPDIELVAQNAFQLQQILERMSGRLNMTIDEFCKAYGARLGHLAAEGTVLGIVALLGAISYWLGLVIR